MKKHAFIKLMKLATQGMFLYNGELFKQVDGVAIGSLGPTLAYFFLANLENNILNNADSFFLKMYLRYADDIFAIYDDSSSITKYLNL